MEMPDRRQRSSPFSDSLKHVSMSIVLTILLYGIGLFLIDPWQIGFVVFGITAFAFALLLGTWWWTVSATLPALLLSVVLLSTEDDEWGISHDIGSASLLLAGTALLSTVLGVAVAKHYRLGMFASASGRGSAAKPASRTAPPRVTRR